MRSITLIFLLGLLSSSQSYAQMRQMIWPLPNALDVNTGWNDGPKMLLDFHTDPPIVIELPNDPLYGPHEAISAICNRWGQLQFYSDNHRVWNGFHALIENIENLNANTPPDASVFSTVANATLLLPFPGDSMDRFFLLWTMRYLNDGAAPMFLQYSVIDRYAGTSGQGILLDSGDPYLPMGDVSTQEKLTAIKHGNGRDWWIVCRKGTINSDTLISMLFTPRGIETIQNFHAPKSTIWPGNLKSSNNGTLLAETAQNGEPSSVIYIYRFNRCSGVIEFKDSMMAPMNTFWYGLAFSPNSKLLYAGTGETMQLYQLSIAADTIANHMQIVDYGSGRFYGHFSLGPNGKIYCVQLPFFFDYTDPSWQHIGVINYPDKEGVACEFNPAGLNLNGNMIAGAGLPNHPNYDLGPLRGSICDSLPDPVIASVPVQAVPSDFSVTLYPNPTSQEFTVVSSNADMVELVIYNALGKEIWRTKNVLQRMSVSVAEWPMGIYTVIASTTNGVIDKKQLVIQR